MHELSLRILDALENSMEVAATSIELIIEGGLVADWLPITVRDSVICTTFSR